MLVILDANTRPHRPVQAWLKANMRSAKKTVFRKTPPLPTEPLVGPIRKPPDAEAARALALSALEHAVKGNVEQCFEAYKAAFALWATQAKTMVAQPNDLEVQATSSRATKPTAIAVPLVPGLTKRGNDSPKVSVMNSLLQRSQQLTAILTEAWRAGGESWDKLASFNKKTIAYQK